MEYSMRASDRVRPGHCEVVVVAAAVPFWKKF